MEREYADFPELPQGLSMALAQNPAALERFVSLSPAAQRAFIARTHQVESRDGMHRMVCELSDGGAWG